MRISSWNTLVGFLVLFLSSCAPLSGGSASKSSRLKSARSLAQDWIEEAAVNTNSSNYLSKIDQIDSVLQNREIVLDNIPDGPCSENTEDTFTLAYVENPPQDSDIYVCQEIFDFANEIIAQVLIHESIHVTGVIDECDTTTFEMNIMNLAGQRPFKNAYIDDPAYPNCSSDNFSHINFLILSEDFETPKLPVRWNSISLPKGAKY